MSFPPPIVSSTGRRCQDPEGDGDTLIAIDVETLEIQRRTLDMAIKTKGMYAPEEINLTGLEKLGERLTNAHKRVDDADRD